MPVLPIIDSLSCGGIHSRGCRYSVRRCTDFDSDWPNSPELLGDRCNADALEVMKPVHARRCMPGKRERCVGKRKKDEQARKRFLSRSKALRILAMGTVQRSILMRIAFHVGALPAFA
jgi:hypothetical protein